MNKLIRVLKYYIPSKEALRNNEVAISTIQDLYNQCMEFINYLGDVAIQLSREGDGYYKILDEVPQVGEGEVIIKTNGTLVDVFNVNSPVDKDIDIAIPTKVSQFENDLGYLTQHQDISGKVDRSELATVATSGDYNDLDNLPAIPVLPDFATVALTGEYDDLLHKPIIPTVPTNISAFNNDAGYLTQHQDISGKVDKVTGKGLSTEDYTTAEKTKLGNIEAGAQVNVKPDWNATSGDAEILNKPTIPTVPSNVSAFNNDAGYLTQHQDISGKANVADLANVATSGDYDDLANKPTYALGQTAGGAADRAGAIPAGALDSTSTSTVMTATVPGITVLKTGVCVWLKNGVVTSASNFTLNINGLGAKPCYTNMAAATRDTTIFNVNYTMLFVYEEDRVSGGAWICYRGYDANTNTIGYQLRTNSSIRKTADKFRYYKLLFSSADDTHWVPASVSTVNSATQAKTVNDRPINPFGEIVYVANTTSYAAEANIGATAIWQQYALTLGYSFNRTGAALVLTVNAPVYIKCAPQADGSAIIDADNPYVQALPNTKDGKIYIYLGMAYSETAMELSINHPVYWHDGTGIRLWTGVESSGGGQSVGKPMIALDYYAGKQITDADLCALLENNKGQSIPISHLVDVYIFYDGKYRSLDYEGYVYQYSDNNSWYIENAGGDMYIITPDIATDQINIRFEVD